MIDISIVASFVLAAFAAYLIAVRTYRGLIKSSNKYPKLLSVLAFVGSFLVILVILGIIILYNLPFER